MINKYRYGPINIDQIISSLLLILIVWSFSNIEKYILDKLFYYKSETYLVPFKFSFGVFLCFILLVWGLIKNKIRFNFKVGNGLLFLEPNWVSTHQETITQGIDYITFHGRGKLLKYAKCDIIPENTYFRFGFKLVDEDTPIFGFGQKMTKDLIFYGGQRKSCGIVHVGKEENINYYHVTNIFSEEWHDFEKKVEDFPSKKRIKLKIVIERDNILNFYINNKWVINKQIPEEWRKKIFFMGWGDNNFFRVKVNKIRVKFA